MDRKIKEKLDNIEKKIEAISCPLRRGLEDRNMIVTSKNGIKLDIQPKNKWSLYDWSWVFDQANIIKNQNIHIQTDGWKFTFGTIIPEEPK